MNTFGDSIPIIIQTQDGDVPIEHVYVGDIVYDYKTSEEYEVRSIVNSRTEKIYKVEYTDGRVDYYTLSELMFIGYSITNVDTLLRERENFMLDHPTSVNSTRGNIKISAITYNKSSIRDILVPDPYIAGALLIYGNYDDEYINLPLDRPATNAFLAHKYQLNFADKLSDNTVYFTYNGAPRNQILRWWDFFPLYTFRARNKNYPIIPMEYRRASLNDRWQFIRGVFDTGFDEYFFPDNCAIAHHDEEKLKAVQEVLWSLGVLSIISYDPHLPVARGRKYRLDVQTHHDNYPGFFYYIDFMEKMMLNKKRIVNREPKFKLQIKSIEWHAIGHVKKLVLDRPHRVYLTGNFLPRVSV